MSSTVPIDGRAVFTDLDGTLLDREHRLSQANRQTLRQLGAAGISRVIVTGRSLYSARRVLDDAFPIDVLVTSSGAGIFEFPSLTLLYRSGLRQSDTQRAVAALTALQLDFMVHEPVPDNHHFRWYRCQRDNPDFDRRLAHYADCHQPLAANEPLPIDAAQLLVVVPPGESDAIHAELNQRLAGLNVVRTTSPLDHISTWYEIFPSEVSKARAASWICQHFGIDRGSTLAVGNDYNDLDLLRWGGTARVVGNAPPELRHEFEAVADNNTDGFSESVSQWLAESNF
ncbi:MAG: HAD-IIB family hydrolase [Anaerolineales bacterium]|jgi:hypothetical protein|nr:HAD-IIB family hydrolase [Anaerolineales bacterium]